MAGPEVRPGSLRRLSLGDSQRDITAACGSPFAAIANGPELTKVTLATWLSNHKNFPEEMYFEVPAEHLDDIAAYILTLRRTQQTH